MRDFMYTVTLQLPTEHGSNTVGFGPNTFMRTVNVRSKDNNSARKLARSMYKEYKKVKIIKVQKA